MRVYKKIIYGFLVVATIVTGIYFVFSETEDVRITAIVPDREDVVSEEGSSDNREDVVLGWSHGAVFSNDSGDSTQESTSGDIKSDEKDDDVERVARGDKIDESRVEIETEIVSGKKGAAGGGDHIIRPKTLAAFSVLVYWFRQPNPPASVDFNGDGAVSIIDLSIFAFNQDVVL